MKRFPNPIPGIVADMYHNALLYGNVIGGLDMAVAKANNQVIAWNTITVGTFLNRCQRKWEFSAGIYDRFAGGLH